MTEELSGIWPAGYWAVAIFLDRSLSRALILSPAMTGLPLNDLVSYEQKHNEVNREDNRDGTDNNLSWNCGFEGLAMTLRLNGSAIAR